jgi:putative membrane protein
MKRFTQNSVNIAVLAFLLIALAIVPTVSADPEDEDGEGCWGGGGWNAGSWWFMAAMMVFMGIGALVLFVFVLDFRGEGHLSLPGLHRPRSQEPPTHQGGENPHLVLDHRYASGEISREEYLQMKNDIEQ